MDAASPELEGLAGRASVSSPQVQAIQSHLLHIQAQDIRYSWFAPRVLGGTAAPPVTLRSAWRSTRRGRPA